PSCLRRWPLLLDFQVEVGVQQVLPVTDTRRPPRRAYAQPAVGPLPVVLVRASRVPAPAFPVAPLRAPCPETHCDSVPAASRGSYIYIYMSRAADESKNDA